MSDQITESNDNQPEEIDEYSDDNMTIGVQVAPEFKEKVEVKRLVNTIRNTLENELESDIIVEMGLLIEDDSKIQELNRQFRGIDAPTDVLSFATSESDIFTAIAPEMPVYLGDVVISYPQAEEQAQNAGHSTEEELGLLVVHGVLHLLGYDHDTEEKKAQMWAKQESILGKNLID